MHILNFRFCLCYRSKIFCRIRVLPKSQDEYKLKTVTFYTIDDDFSYCKILLNSNSKRKKEKYKLSLSLLYILFTGFYRFFFLLSYYEFIMLIARKM